MYILGINFSHHGSICLLKDGEVVFFLEEERLSRKKYSFIKNDSHNVIKKIKDYTDRIDYICCGWPYPFDGVDSKEIMFNYDENVVKEMINSLTARLLIDHPEYNLAPSDSVWSDITEVSDNNTKVYLDSYSHHHIHALQSFYNSGFDECICVVADGQGSSKPENDTKDLYERESIWRFNYNESHLLHCNYTDDMHGVGSTYSRITGELGFQGGFEEGKTMGLSSYNSNYVDFNIVNNVKLANRVQSWSQEQILSIIKYGLQIHNSKNVCISGGYGLNCVANYYFRKNLPADVNLYCEPIANDAGQAIGLAKKLHHKLTGDTTIRPQKSIYYGPNPSY